MSTDTAATPAGQPPPVVPPVIATIESAPDSDATMLQALDAAAAPTGGGEDEEDDVFNSGGGELTDIDQFEKTLQSDVNENQALLLLCDVQSCDPVFAAFNDDDMERLARYLSVLSFEAGERIISKGEPASFCGIVLSGCFHAVISDTTTIPLSKGALVGEMSYYEGGKRTADIVSAEPSVLAVISFTDLKKLQPFEAELVQKFLTMLATISIRKLRNMMKPAGPPAVAATPAVAEEKKADGTAAPAASPSAPVASPTATVTPAAPAAAVAEKSDPQESLFKHRLKKKEQSLSQSAAELEEAKKAAEEAKKKHSLAQKKERAQKYKATSLEYKLAKAEKELTEMKEQLEKAVATQEKTHQRNLLLGGQVTNMTTARIQLDKDLAELQSKYDTLAQSKEELSLGTSLMISNLENKLDAVTKQLSQIKQYLEVEQTKVKILTQKYEEVLGKKEQLEFDHRSVTRELETSRGNVMILQEKVAHLDAVRKDYLTRLNDEELAHISWKSKAELYLGDYTRLLNRMKEMEYQTVEHMKDRRLTLRRITQLKTLIKQIIVRSFIRNVRTRKLIFAILKRVNSVVTSRIVEEEDSRQAASGGLSGSGNNGGGGIEIDGVSTGTAGIITGENQTVSAQQARKDRAKLLSFLKVDRTPVSKLIWLLDEELTNFESPFHALQTENTQLRHTLDSFFKRNIGLVQQFMSAKSTYESLHREYARLREAFDRMKRKEKTAASFAAAMQGGQAGMLARQQQTQLEEEFLEENQGDSTTTASGGNHTPNFAASLPTPTPFSPSTLNPLSTAQLGLYAQAFSHQTPLAHGMREKELQYGNISVGGPRAPPSVASPNAATGKKGAAARYVSAASGSPSGSSPSPSPSPSPSEAAQFSPRPPATVSSPAQRLTVLASPRSSRPQSGLSSAPSTPQQPAVVGSPWQPSGSYDISLRSGGNDVASRSAALRQQIQSSISTKVHGTSVTRDQWNGQRPSSSPRSMGHSNQLGVPSPGSPHVTTSHHQQQQYPHAVYSQGLRSPNSSVYARHIDQGAFVESPHVQSNVPHMSSNGKFFVAASPRHGRDEEKQHTTGWQ